jgi:hypothetical protein
MKSRITYLTVAGIACGLIGACLPAQADYLKTYSYTRTMTEPAATTVTKVVESPVMIEKTVESPVMIEKTVESPVIIDRTIENPIIIDKTIESPVLLDTTVDTPVLIEKAKPMKIIEKPVVIKSERSHLFNLDLLDLFNLGMF